MQHEYMELDFKLKTPEERTAHVRKVLSKADPDSLTQTYLNSMSDYILMVGDSGQTKKEKKSSAPIITNNRQVTVNKRQVSYEDVVSGLEAGEDGFQALINQDPAQLLDYREPISDDEVEEIPYMRDHLDLVERLKSQLATATDGRHKYLLKKQIIETYQQMYVLKASYHGWPAKSKVASQLKAMSHMPLPESIRFDERQMPVSDACITLFNPVHVSFLLTYYSSLKQDSYEDLDSDMRWLLIDLEEIVDAALKDEPLLYALLEYKVDGYTNEEIIEMMRQEHDVEHSAQYYSTVWKRKIPKMIADKAMQRYVIWHYNEVEYGKWKKCRCCGEVKLAHPLFFQSNTSSKDAFYSICRDCRAKLYKMRQEEKRAAH